MSGLNPTDDQTNNGHLNRYRTSTTTIVNPYLRNRLNTNARRNSTFTTPQLNPASNFPRVSIGPGDRTDDTPTSPLAQENLITTLGINTPLPSETPTDSENTPSTSTTPTVEELQVFLESLSSNQHETEARQHIIDFASNHNITLGQQTLEVDTNDNLDTAIEDTNRNSQSNEELLTQQTRNLAGNRTNDITNNIITPIRTPNNDTGETEKVPESYKPKDTRLLPVRAALASQPKAVRPILEKICSTVLSDTKVIYDRARTVSLWDDQLVNRITSNIEVNLDNLDPDYYIPKSLKLNNVTLKIPQSLLQDENYKNTMNTIQNEFEQAKNHFRIVSSKCAKDIADLKLRHATSRRIHDIVKQFLLVVIYLVTHHKQERNTTARTSTKTIPVLSACILLKYVDNIQESFYTWAGITKEELKHLILKELGEPVENHSTFVTTPILGHEKDLANSIITNFLDKTFIELTETMANRYFFEKQSKDDDKKLNQIIKNHEIEQLTSATKIGLDKANVLDSTANLEAFLKARDAALEKKLLTKFQKNFHGTKRKNPPLGKAIKNGNIEKVSKKQKTTNPSKKASPNLKSALKKRKKSVSFQQQRKGGNQGGKRNGIERGKGSRKKK
jgi:hypothetical protein